MEISFLNVDLEIESNQNLQSIIENFGKNISVLYYGKRENDVNFGAFSLSDSFEKNADEIILVFCSLIENFSTESKRIWKNSISKRFDIGFQSGDSPKNYQTEIRTDTIEIVAKLGASIVITIYPKSE